MAYEIRYKSNSHCLINYTRKNDNYNKILFDAPLLGFGIVAFILGIKLGTIITAIIILTIVKQDYDQKHQPET